jgi:hypothetical protein
MTKEIQFDTTVISIDSTILLLIPREQSAKLPSRGQVMVRGTINSIKFESPLEPDGKGSHWLKIDEPLQKLLQTKVGDAVHVEMEPSKEWPEPKLPADLQKALSKDAKIRPLWDDITPMARWDWLRWINSTKSNATRQHRIEVAFSKLEKGSRRPCCFNRTMCTDPYVSKSGVLSVS